MSATLANGSHAATRLRTVAQFVSGIDDVGAARGQSNPGREGSADAHDASCMALGISRHAS